jgi:hypothetical protein
MKINNKTHITMSDEDVKDAIIKYLYQNQGLSGIFDVKFFIKNKPIPTYNYLSSIDHWVFDGAEIEVDQNEK